MDSLKQLIESGVLLGEWDSGKVSGLEVVVQREYIDGRWRRV